MYLSREQREELIKLRVLEYLSNPPQDMRFFAEGNQGATATELGRVIRHEANRHRLLPEMEQAGLIARRDKPEADGKSKPYFITDEGRRYLDEARQKAMLLEPEQRRGWADQVGGEARQALAAVLRGLPEFQDGGEERIQEVSRALADAIGLPARQTGRGEAERSGR